MRMLKIAAIVCAGFASGALAQQAPQGITVNGEGIVSLAPDTATIRLGVSERAASASDAMAQTSEKVRGILDQLDTLKIAGLDRQTSGLYLGPSMTTALAKMRPRWKYRAMRQVTPSA